MKVLKLFMEKGGVGKTTFAGLIGAGLAMRGNKVLLLDADGQANLTTNMNRRKKADFLRFAKWGNRSHPDYVKLAKIIQPVPKDVCPENLYLVAGSNETWGIASSTNEIDLLESLSARFAQLEKVFDFVIFDTQPSATLLHTALGYVTDYYICPTEPEPLAAFDGLESAIGHITNLRNSSLSRGRDKARLLGIIPNNYRMNTSLHQHIYEKLVELYGDLVWDPIPQRTAIPEAQYMQTTLMHDAPDLETNKHIWSIVDRVEAIKETV